MVAAIIKNNIAAFNMGIPISSFLGVQLTEPVSDIKDQLHTS
tara:strand:- start:193 stop:318 length:126 start_codon:yes stop_codon:yes gene_type:complete